MRLVFVIIGSLFVAGPAQAARCSREHLRIIKAWNHGVNPLQQFLENGNEATYGLPSPGKDVFAWRYKFSTNEPVVLRNPSAGPVHIATCSTNQPEFFDIFPEWSDQASGCVLGWDTAQGKHERLTIKTEDGKIVAAAEGLTFDSRCEIK